MVVVSLAFESFPPGTVSSWASLGSYLGWSCCTQAAPRGLLLPRVRGDIILLCVPRASRRLPASLSLCIFPLSSFLALPPPKGFHIWHTCSSWRQSNLLFPEVWNVKQTGSRMQATFLSAALPQPLQKRNKYSVFMTKHKHGDSFSICHTQNDQ